MNMTTGSPLWKPAPERAQRSQMYEFMTRIAARHGVAADWESLRRWSIEYRDQFWAEMLSYAGIEPSAPAKSVTSGAGMLGTKWFNGLTLNYARHMLRFDDDQPAIFYENEEGRTMQLSHRQLRAAVACCAHALKQHGVKRGDRVAGFLCNTPETIIAMLAAVSLGAVWSSCSPDFGVTGVIDRFGQIQPAVLFVTDGYAYGGKYFDTLDRVREIVSKLNPWKVVIVPYREKAFDPAWERALQRGPDVGATQYWREFNNFGFWNLDFGLKNNAANQGPATTADQSKIQNPKSKIESPAELPPLTFEEVPFDHPLFIMYSSGTTGVPKCIVHGHGGTLLQHMKELMLHTDLRRDERIFYFTTCGWMMWNWLVSSLGVGAAIVLYEGNPGQPTMHRLWDMAARLKINVFGTSPKFLAACQKAQIHPGHEHDLAALRCVLSTGSPLSAELFRWTYEEIKQDLQLSSISGGTDIISCFMLGNPLLPVYEGEIQCRGLGMDVHAWNENQQPVINQKGELVCTSPFPSQPIYFWNDPDGKKYRKAYFDYFSADETTSPSAARSDASQSKIQNPKSKMELVWRHGDFIEITDTGGVIVYGRSDATLNPGGVRIGTAEIYRLVEAVPEILDSLVIGKNTADQDVDIVLFVVLRPGLTLDAALERKLRDAIAAGATKRHVPRHIRQVSAIPVTISGKKVEMAVTQIVHGEEVRNRDALANPDILDEFKKLSTTL